MTNKWTWIIGGGALGLGYFLLRGSPAALPEVPVSDGAAPVGGGGSGGSGGGSSGGGAPSGDYVTRSQLVDVLGTITQSFTGALSAQSADFQSSLAAMQSAYDADQEELMNAMSPSGGTVSEPAFADGPGFRLDLSGVPTGVSEPTTISDGKYYGEKPQPKGQLVYLEEKRKQAKAAGNVSLDKWANSAIYAEEKLAEAKAEGNKGLEKWAQAQLNKLYAKQG